MAGVFRMMAPARRSGNMNCCVLRQRSDTGDSWRANPIWLKAPGKRTLPPISVSRGGVEPDRGAGRQAGLKHAILPTISGAWKAHRHGVACSMGLPRRSRAAKRLDGWRPADQFFAIARGDIS